METSCAWVGSAQQYQGSLKNGTVWAEGALTCGGVPMSPAGEPAAAAEADPAQLGGTQIGKRYTDAADTIQVLCTKAGKGTLALDGHPLAIQAAKPLPASD